MYLKKSNLLKMKQYILVVLSCVAILTQAQPISYQLTSKKDTVNMIDKYNLKQGKWIVRVEDNMGEPGYQEEGNYKANEKVGKWRLYSLMGDPVGEENYINGQKSGKQLYYDIRANLVREENWRAITPDNAYDTIAVPDWKKDVTGNITKMVVVKLMGNALRDGAWKYYDDNGKLVRAEKYIYDKLAESTIITYDYATGKVQSKEQLRYDIETGKAVAQAGYSKPKEATKPQVVLDFEKTKKGKKTKKFQDGSTGGK